HAGNAAGPVVAAPPLALVADPADAAAAALARTLAAALGEADGPAPLPLPARGWSDMLERLDVDQPRLAVARYDALRLARQSAAAPLAVLTPLSMHEVQVLVRADSPLRHLHELRGLRINAGPGAGARRLSARTLYEAMFGTPLPGAPGDDLDEAAALQALLRGELDAVVLVAPQPAPPLAALPAAQARALRLLALDARHPTSRHVLDTFLPARLRPEGFAPGLLDAPLPAPALMSFLVTGGRRTPQADAALGRFAAALCRRLPLLARLDPAWRGVDPRRRLPTSWPNAAAAEAALRDCAPDPDPAPALAARTPELPR
uniref:TAXI family TRAP transporter solute-binding subunit n=1 Tax=Azohydromonas aeria TaxID=2590212 RepID=UPI0018E0268E